MWQPTHIKVTVKQAKSLLTKGKNGTNDVFVVIGIGKEKFQTSIKERAAPSVEWREECELAIPSQGNKAGLQLTVYHHNSLGIDEFLGQVSLPLNEFDVYEKPKYRTYRLKGKPEKDKKKGEKERGELEVMVNFIVKSGSFLDLSKKEKHKTSISSLKHLGGSLMSIGAKEKQGLKNFAKSVSSKMDKIAKPKIRKSKTAKENSTLSNDLMLSQQRFGDADPGVISDDDDDDFRFDDDIKVGTRTSSPHSTLSRGSSLMQEQVLETDYDVGSYDEPENDHMFSFGKTPPKPPRIIDETKEKLSAPVEPISRDLKSSNSDRITSFSDAKPFSTKVNLIPPASEFTTHDIIEEESSFEMKFDNELNPFEEFLDPASESVVDLTNHGSSFHSIKSQTPSVQSSSLFFSSGDDKAELFVDNDQSMTHKNDNLPQLDNIFGDKTGPNKLTINLNEPPVNFNDGRDSAVSLGNDHRSSFSQESTNIQDGENVNDNIIIQRNNASHTSVALTHHRAPSDTSSAVSIASSTSHTGSKDDLKVKSEGKFDILEEKLPKKYEKSLTDSNEEITERRYSDVRRYKKRITSAGDIWCSDDSGTAGSISARTSGEFSAPSVVRTGSLSEKPTSEPFTDEWEKKLYGRNGITGSTENISITGSGTSLNMSRASSIQDMRREDSFTRLPEVKALTLERKALEENEDGDSRKHKRNKGISGFKHRFFNKIGGSREKLNEDSRFVEGGNDRVPSPPTRSSKLPQEVHDKFAGKSREDLLEAILRLQSSLDKQVKHSSDLEDYIDNLLLRVMEATPHILQGPISKNKSIKSFGHY